MVDHNNNSDRYQLNPDDFPRRIDLEVSEEVLAYLQRISDRTGRSINEIAAAIIAQSVEQMILNGMNFSQESAKVTCCPP